MKENYNYLYDIDVKLKCEKCSNQFIRHDKLKTTYEESRESLEEFYENINEECKEEELTVCDKCNGYMFEEEVIKFKETKLKNNGVEI